MKQLLKIYSTVCFLLLVLTVRATHELGNSRLSSPSLISGASTTMIDTKYGVMISVPPSSYGFKEAGSKTRVRLGLDQANMTYVSAFDLSFTVQLDYLTFSGTSFTAASDTRTLNIKYDPALGGANYTDMSVFEASGGYSTKVTVLSIKDNTTSSTITTPPVNVYLELETDDERYYDLDYVNAPFGGSSNLNIHYIQSSEEFEIRWPYIPGAEEYDLEWTWISDDVISPYPVVFDFKNNSTRVRVSSQSYRISNVFETGKVYFRLRGIGRYDGDGNGTYTDNYYTPWTMQDYASIPEATFHSLTCPSFTSLNAYTISSNFLCINVNSSSGCVSCDHERNKNWQYKATYAEEGKKKEVVSYFDGSLRNRQSVTKINSDQDAIVGETYYDYQGRASVQALPVPVEDATIKFYQYNVTSSGSVSGWGFNFSKTTKEPFNREHFDKDVTPGSCNATLTGMEDNLSGFGSAYYYSSYNLDQTFQQGYVPDAETFPYTQTEYTPDNTGRIARQGGVGVNHQLGTGHETKYFYGSPTMQTELDRLFGADVGDYKHYKKNMVVDANGQVSISYLDQEGRTVATALAGNSPTAVSSLASNTVVTLGGDLLNKDNATDVDDDQDNNILSQDGKELTFSSELLVPAHGVYTFDYTMSGTAFTYSCAAANLCYDCIYDLEINILDACGNNPSGFTPLKQKVGNILPEQYSEDGDVILNTVCDGPIKFSNPTSALTATLDIGAYTVYKTLTIDEEALSYYLQQYISNNSCLRTEQSFIDSAMAHVDTSGCDITCEQCVAALGTQEDFITNGGTADQYNRLVTECRLPCAYTSQCEAAIIPLLADMSPGGQYADWENNGTCNPSGFPLSVLNTSNALPVKGGSIPQASWKNPYSLSGSSGTGHYYEDDGSISYIQVVAQTGGGYLPAVASGVTPTLVSGNTYQVEPWQLADVCDFKNAWKNSWAWSLLVYHPEYYYYEWCVTNGKNNVTGNDYTLTYNGHTGDIKTSEHFDSLLTEVADLTLVTGASISPSNGTLSILLDPLGVTPTGSTMSDPYFDSNEPIAGKWYKADRTAHTAASTATVSQLSGTSQMFNGYGGQVHYNAQDRFNNYAGSGLNLWEMTYAIVKGLVAQYGTSLTPASLGITAVSPTIPFGTPVHYDYRILTSACLSTSEMNAAWNKFKFMYLSLKQTMQTEAAESYATNFIPSGGTIANAYNACNDCIGNANYNPLTVPFATWYTLFGYPTSSWSDNWFLLPPVSPTGRIAPCSMFMQGFYLPKVKRFPSMQDASGLADNINVDAEIYQSTGKCPEVLDIEAMLNSMGTAGQLTTSTNLQTVPFYTQRLYNFMYASNHSGTLPSTYPAMNWSPVVSGTGNLILTGSFVRSGTTECTMVLNFPSGSSYNWSNIYSSGNMITHIYDAGFVSYSGSVSTFTVKVDVVNSSLVASTYTVTGTVCGNIGSCSFPPACEANATANILRNLFNQLSMEGALCSSSNTSLGATPYSMNFSAIANTLPTAGNWVWNKTSSSGGVISDLTATTPFYIEFTSTSTGDFQSKLCPASGHTINIVSIVPSSASTAGDCTVTYNNIDGSTTPPTITTGTLSAFLATHANSTAAAKGINLGTCENVSLPCQSDEHKLRDDLEAFLVKNSLSSLSSSSAIDITASHKFTSLMSQYVSGQPNFNTGTGVVTSPHFYWIPNTSTVSTNAGQITGSICSSTLTTAPSVSDACCTVVLSFSNTAASSTYDLRTAYTLMNLVPLPAPTTGGLQYTFSLTAVFHIGSAWHSEPVVGYTTCLPLRQCESCPTSTIATNTSTSSCTSIADFESGSSGMSVYNNTTGMSCTTFTDVTGSSTTLAGCDFLVDRNASGYPCGGSSTTYTAHAGSSLFLEIPAQPTPFVAPFLNITVYNQMVPLTVSGGSGNYACLVFRGYFEKSCDYPFYIDWFMNGSLVSSQFVPATASPGTWLNLDFGNALWSNTTNASYANLELRVRPFASHNAFLLGFDDFTFCVANECAGDIQLCSDPLAPDTFPSIPYVNPCKQAAIDAAVSDGVAEFNNYIDSLKTDFVQQYIHKCMSGAVETFTAQYGSPEYHFTLYYYDQAGNLVQTVPPQGVNLITSSTDLAQVKADRSALHANSAATRVKFTTHSMTTTYTYNSLNQLVKQNTPDGGISYFWYDKLGRLIASQNAKQLADASGGNNEYSYTRYDDLGRIAEVGQMVVAYDFIGASYTTLQTLLNPSTNDYPTNLSPTKTQVTSTYYGDDDSYYTSLSSVPAAVFTDINDSYSRSRVVASTIEAADDANPLTYNHATFYSYDVHGNVKELIQHNPDLTTYGQDFKLMNYDYDLVSGKVNQVSYQPGLVDQFYHRYEYDADNRITHVYTSNNNVIWTRDAKYFYYKHGPLARTELGENKVQGMDYAYTLHGWIKGVNSDKLSEVNDIGKDGNLLGTASNYNNLHNMVSRDAFGYSLSYYTGSGIYDYKPIDNTYVTSSTHFLSDASAAVLSGGAVPSLYNGNIREMVTTYLNQDPTAVNPGSGASIGVNVPAPQLNTYVYDQLNRIIQAKSFKDFNASTNAWNSTSNSAFKENFAYDANGNILTLTRNGNNSSSITMDDLTYHYYDQSGGVYTPNPAAVSPSNATNRLAYVGDAVADGTYSNDLDGQSSGNYTYDGIGNLTGDVKEEIAGIEWTVYGKISKITRISTSTKSDLEFVYDAMGNRVMKTEKPRTGSGYVSGSRWTTTYYVRDAQGNVMAVYQKHPNNLDIPVVDLKEQHIYGSSRIGMLSNTILMPTSPHKLSDVWTHVAGYTTYELSNHLGNVVAVVDDKKIPHNNSGTIDYFLPEIISSTDYYSFGSPMPGRQYSLGTYRYGFNGKELDRETVSNEGGTQDYGMRIYNPSLGRFLSIDPLFKKYPELTPFQFASNTPVMATDLDGLEGNVAIIRKVQGSDEKGKPLRNGRVVEQGDVAGDTYIVGNTVQPGNRGGTSIQILNVDVSYDHGVPKNSVTLIADIPLTIVNSRTNEGTLTNIFISSQSLNDGSAMFGLSKTMSEWAASSLRPGEVVNSVDIDLSSVGVLTGKEMKKLKADLTSTIRSSLANSGYRANIPIHFNSSSAKSTNDNNIHITYTSTINELSTANVPNELNALGFNQGFINSVMQTITNVLNNNPPVNDPNVKTTQNPPDQK